MMVDDYDDEHTLEVEEKMAASENVDLNEELNTLQKVKVVSLPFDVLSTPAMVKVEVMLMFN